MKKNKGNYYISAWGYIGYVVLWSIPVIGWLIWFFNCFSRKTNKRNYARSMICAFIFSLLASIVLAAAIVVLGYLGVSPEITNALKDLQGAL